MFEDFLNVSGCNIANSLLFQAILGTNIVKLLNETQNEVLQIENIATSQKMEIYQLCK